MHQARPGDPPGRPFREKAGDVEALDPRGDRHRHKAPYPELGEPTGFQQLAEVDEPFDLPLLVVLGRQETEALRTAPARDEEAIQHHRQAHGPGLQTRKKSLSGMPMMALVRTVQAVAKSKVVGLNWKLRAETQTHRRRHTQTKALNYTNRGPAAISRRPAAQLQDGQVGVEIVSVLSHLHSGTRRFAWRGRSAT